MEFLKLNLMGASDVRLGSIFVKHVVMLLLKGTNPLHFVNIDFFATNVFFKCGVIMS